MGDVQQRIEAFVSRLRGVPWPEEAGLVSWAAAQGDDPVEATATAPADRVIAAAAAFGGDPGVGARVVAAWVREIGAALPKKDPRLARAAFAAEQAGSPGAVPLGARAKLLDVAQTLLRDSERLARAAEAPHPGQVDDYLRLATLEAQRATAFLCLATVAEEADSFSNLAHAARQLAAAFTAIAGARGEPPGDELLRLAAPLRAAYADVFARATRQ